MGEPGDPGVPTEDQYPTNERANISEGGRGGVGIEDVPGTRTPGEPLSFEPAPTKTDRDTGSLGELTEDVSTSEAAYTKNMVTTDDPYSHDDAAEARSTRHRMEENEG